MMQGIFLVWNAHNGHQVSRLDILEDILGLEGHLEVANFSASWAHGESLRLNLVHGCNSQEDSGSRQNGPRHVHPMWEPMACIIAMHVPEGAGTSVEP